MLFTSKRFSRTMGDNFFIGLADVHGYNTRNASTQHLHYMSAFGEEHGDKRL